MRDWPLAEQRVETAVGGFLLVALGALLLMVAVTAYRPGWLAPRVHYQLELDHGFGVQPGMYVTIAGRRVGTVEDIELTEQRRIELTLGVDKAYAHHVREDSTGSVVQLLAGKNLEIGPGTGPALADGGRLVSGENFDLLLTLQELQLARTLERITAVLEDIDRISSDLKLGEGTADGVEQLLRLLADLDEGRGTLGALLKDDGTLKRTEDTLVAAQDVTDDLAQMAAALSTAAEDLSAASGEVSAASAEISKTAGTTDEVVAQLPETMEQMTRTMQELTKTLEAMQSMPGVRRQMEE